MTDITKAPSTQRDHTNVNSGKLINIYEFFSQIYDLTDVKIFDL